jgi:hypothetical protein
LAQRDDTSDDQSGMPTQRKNRRTVKAKLPDRSAECWTVVQDTGLGCPARLAELGSAKPGRSSQIC